MLLHSLAWRCAPCTTVLASGSFPPSVSATGERLCSYRDLLTLRLMRWLRTDTPEVARAAMTQVRRILDELGDDLWMIDQRDSVPTIKVTRSGKVINEAGPAEMLVGQRGLDGDAFDLFAPFGSAPDLRAPRSGCASCQARSPVNRIWCNRD